MMEPTLRSAQVLNQEAEDIGFEGKDISEYVKEQQKLDREEGSMEKHPDSGVTMYKQKERRG